MIGVPHAALKRKVGNHPFFIFDIGQPRLPYRGVTRKVAFMSAFRHGKGWSAPCLAGITR
jgi:hypothetical protein